MIELKDLTKKFGEQTAVDHVNLTIETGEFFGLLGPNGAGKTTTISMLSTVLLPTAGEILLDGKPLTRRASAEKRKISVITQEFSMRQDMTVQEVMEYQGRLYYMKKAEIREKTEQLLTFTDLIDHRRKTVRYLSGGMKRKLMVCRGLMTDPDVLLLDEPTAGMDAIARRQMWALLRRINNRKMTIILTTHYMEEAEALCDRVALINRGKLGEVDSPAALIDALGKYAVDLVTEDDTKSVYFKTREEAIAYLETIPSEAAAGSADAASKVHASLRNTTLEDVFVERIGRRLTVR